MIAGYAATPGTWNHSRKSASIPSGRATHRGVEAPPNRNRSKRCTPGSPARTRRPNRPKTRGDARPDMLYQCMHSPSNPPTTTLRFSVPRVKPRRTPLSAGRPPQQPHRKAKRPHFRPTRWGKPTESPCTNGARQRHPNTAPDAAPRSARMESWAIAAILIRQHFQQRAWPLATTRTGPPPAAWGVWMGHAGTSGLPGHCSCDRPVRGRPPPAAVPVQPAPSGVSPSLPRGVRALRGGRVSSGAAPPEGRST